MEIDEVASRTVSLTFGLGHLEIGVSEDSIGYRRDGWTTNVPWSISSRTTLPATVESAYDRAYVDWWENWSSIRILFGGVRRVAAVAATAAAMACVRGGPKTCLHNNTSIPYTIICVCSHTDLYSCYFCFNFFFTHYREWKFLVRIFFIFVIRPAGRWCLPAAHPWHTLIIIYTFMLQRRPDGRWPRERTMILLSSS